MQRILIIGGNGAGKTTFSRALSKKLQLPLTHLDALYWKDHWQSVANDTFDGLLVKELEKEKWILDGNMSRTLQWRLDYADTVVYFDFPRTTCVYGVLKRYMTHIGVSRPDMGGYCPERISWAFVKGVWNFNLNNRKRFYDIIKTKPEVNLIVLKSHRQVKNFLRNHE